MLSQRLGQIILRRHSLFSNTPPVRSLFESSISLKKLYPNSSLDITKSSQISSSKPEGPFTGYIPVEDLNITYSKSSGPGGQNVNKVNSKVDLRFHLSTSTWIPDQVKEDMKEKYRTSINAEGFLIIRSDRTRSQQLNLADALDKLRFMIYEAIQFTPPPSYKDLEISRRRQEKATRERLRIKRERSMIKKDRQGLDLEL